MLGLIGLTAKGATSILSLDNLLINFVFPDLCCLASFVQDDLLDNTCADTFHF